MTFPQARPQRRGLPDGSLACRAPAKVNLSLRVLGVRPDGFHELDSIVAKVTLYDELTLRRRAEGRLTLAVEGPFDCGPVEENLVLRAARTVRERAAGTGVQVGADIKLVKRIPPGTGLGGGSSDAAAALAALNELWSVGLVPDDLARIAAEVGSDVPLFLNAPAVRIRGRGEIVQPIELAPFWAVLILPEATCPTAEVYRAFDALTAEADRGTVVPPTKTPTSQGPVDPERWIADLRLPPSRWRGQLVNDLLPAAMRVCPPLKELLDRLASASGLPVHMTGSGSGLFLLADQETQARQIAARLPAETGRRVVVALNPW